MSSQLGKVGAPKRSVYSMNKFGMEGLTKGMALELAPFNIRVNTICPTFVVTPMTKKGFFKRQTIQKNMIKKIPLGRVLRKVSEIASAVVFMASDASSMITGTSFTC